MALTSIFVLVVITFGFNLRKSVKNKGRERKEQRARPTAGTELFMLPTLRTDDKERRETTVNSNL